MAHKFPNFFYGKIKLNYKHINESIPPVPRPARWIPLHLQKMVDAGLEKLEKESTTEQVDGPTLWISALVVIKQISGYICAWVDMKMTNTASLRERHPTPTVEEITHSLIGAIVFFLLLFFVLFFKAR